MFATGERVGGLVGINGHSYITDSYATGSVTGGGKVGGLVGTTGCGVGRSSCGNVPIKSSIILFKKAIMVPRNQPRNG